jgi:exopolysaccharide biosynthesis polyprenyl glycosylphosphotransferase
MLLAADLSGLAIAFLAAELLASYLRLPIDLRREGLLFILTLPAWVLVAKLYGLYDRDEERTHHSTVDEFAGVFHLLTVCAWLLVACTWAFGVHGSPLKKAVIFWACAAAIVPTARSAARSLARKRPRYVQNTIVVGAGTVGQLVARKLIQHPEYGLRLVGFVDSNPRERRPEVRGLPILGCAADLASLVEAHGVERVFVAFAGDSNEELLAAVRSLAELNVQVDIVPRLFEVVNPNVDLRVVEGMPLIGLPPAKLSRSSRFLKRTLDVAGASLGLILTGPLFAYAVWRIKRESPGPVLFRQERVGFEMRRFTMLKFRTMRVDADQSRHEEYIRSTMDAGAAPGANGLYKLERASEVTRFGRWLRKTSLDEVPQLINVLRGDMSLVGPRPCIPYELEYFEPHHFERFLIRPGLTGLWQVQARARSTFGEALEMDVAYVRGWSLGLDLALLCRTPAQLIRPATTA